MESPAKRTPKHECRGGNSPAFFYRGPCVHRPTKFKLDVGEKRSRVWREPTDVTSESPDANHPSPAKDNAATGLGDVTSIPASSKKQAFDDVMTPLTAGELLNPGTQKVILYMLNEAKTENAILDGFVERFHDADKRAAVLQEELLHERKTSSAIDIAFGVGTTLGGALIGAGYFFWSLSPPQPRMGWFFFLLGAALLIGGTAVKLAKR